MPTYHAIFALPLPKGEYDLDVMAEEMTEEVECADHYQELFDYDDDDGELCFRFSFSFDVGEHLQQPHGFHPHTCQRDCRYCDALDSWQDALEREEEEIREEIESQLADIEGFDRLEFIDD